MPILYRLYNDLALFFTGSEAGTLYYFTQVKASQSEEETLLGEHRPSKLRMSS